LFISIGMKTNTTRSAQTVSGILEILTPDMVLPKLHVVNLTYQSRRVIFITIGMKINTTRSAKAVRDILEILTPNMVMPKLYVVTLIYQY
jgi:hypothetical protein